MVYLYTYYKQFVFINASTADLKLISLQLLY